MFDTNEEASTVIKAEAKKEIIRMAKNQGIDGTFKVFYDGQMISTPEDLPDEVELGKIQVSAVLDQA